MKYVLLIILSLILFSCQKSGDEKVATQSKKDAFISQNVIDKVSGELIKKFGDVNKFRIERGVTQAASLWFESDGSSEEFEKFCMDNFISDSVLLDKTFYSLEKHFENIEGNFGNMSLNLRFPVDIETGSDPTPVDLMFAGYSPSSHIAEDFFANKIAFYILLNFPNYSLEEKNTLGEKWTRKEWAYARVGDYFTSRLPADLAQKFARINADADNYIANYNIYMGNLINPEGKATFPADMKLISHWNLRDELKANYANPDGFRKQEMIYKVMERIISQEIPELVINNKDVKWNPFSNVVLKDNKEQTATPEPNTRYQHLLNNFKALKEMDKYYPFFNTYIKRQFEKEMEMSFEQVESMFVEFISSEQVKQTGELIKKRLGRNLQPFDIWYDGFKARSSLNIDDINTKLAKMYPNSEAFGKDLPNILVKLGFKPERAKWLADKIAVDPSRGAGHAWGSKMRTDKSHLRTRVGANGMDYKGYNIAIHEFGHNVEQTFSLYNIDYYPLAGVPNTAFTENFAFIFQSRDLKILGIKNNNPQEEQLNVLDNLWSAYEIMGVALVDMYVWKWLYENENATPEQLKARTIEIAKEVWNKYYAPVIGVKDSPVLAIYSHMISYPLYLSAYPLGHLIEFQIEQFINGKDFGLEVERMSSLGRITPQYWMKNAVGQPLSVKPTLEAGAKALLELNK